MSVKVREKISIEPGKGMQQVLDFWIQELTVDHDGTEEMLIQDPELWWFAYFLGVSFPLITLSL